MFQSLKALSFALVLTLGFASTLSVQAEELVEGKVVAAARCLCAASLIVTLGDRTGHISDDQMVAEVTLQAGETTITIQNPEKDIRYYYVIYNVSEDAQVVAALEEKGINAEALESVSIVSFKASADTPLYNDHNKSQQL